MQSSSLYIIDPLYIIIILVIILGSVVLHELAHGLVAYWLGDSTAKDAGRLTLNPIKHIDLFMSIIVPVVLYIMNAPVFGGAKPVPVNYRNLKWREWGMALVALAGPFTNFLIALLAFLIGYFSGALRDLSSGMAFFIFAKIVQVNLGFMLFNLIPIPPLDGSRALYAIAPDSVRDIMAQMERYGIIIIYMLIFLFSDIFSGFMANGINGILHFFYSLVGVQ